MKLSETLRVTRSSPKALVLIGVNVLLAVTLAVALFGGTEVDSLLATPDQKIASAPIDWQAPPPVTMNLEVIQSQPLFHSSRTFYVPPDPAGATMAPPPDYRIAGAMALPNKPVTVFLVHNQSSERTKIQTGDVLEGWAVEAASNKLVVLSMNGRRAELTAGKSSGAPAPDAQSLAAPAIGTSMGLQKVSLASTRAAEGSQGGVRVLSGGSSRTFSTSTSNALPKPSPEDIGVRLYKPPPTQ